MDFNTAVFAPPDMSADKFSDMISTEIMEKYEPCLISQIIENEFDFLSPDDRHTLKSKAQKNALQGCDEIMSKIRYNRRKSIICDELLKCLSENGCIVISGFISFRLKEYRDELYDLCINAYDEFEAEREYNDFIEMLRFFISVQEPREEVIHLIKTDGRLRLFNKRKRDVTDIYFSEFPHPPEELTADDIALSALISVAPAKLIIHDSAENEKIYETIRLIFPNVTFR